MAPRLLMNDESANLRRKIVCTGVVVSMKGLVCGHLQTSIEDSGMKEIGPFPVRRTDTQSSDH
jgi:hypothetical protein